MRDIHSIIEEATGDLPSDEAGFKTAIKFAMEVTQELQDEAARRAEQFLSPPSEEPERYSKFLDGLGAVAQLWSGEHRGIPTSPSPLASMLVLGGLGATGGYLGGKAVNRFVSPDRPTHTPAIGAALGAMAGVSPGLVYAYLNSHAGEPTWTGSFLDLPHIEDADRPTSKRATFSAFNPDAFNSTVWNDPYVANRLSTQEKAQASGLVYAARNLPGNRGASLVTPLDVARTAMHMGAGAMSGALVGRGLGMLMGLPPDTQNRIKQVGTFAGAIRGLMPLAYGG